MDEIQKKLLKEIADIEKTPMGAYNIWIFSLIWILRNFVFDKT